MFLGCAEISISVIVKCAIRWNYQSFLSAWGACLLSFSALEGGGEKIAELWFARGISTKAVTMIKKMVQV